MIHCLMCISLGVNLTHINGDIIYWSLQELSSSETFLILSKKKTSCTALCLVGTGVECEIYQIQTDDSLR